MKLSTDRYSHVDPHAEETFADVQRNLPGIKIPLEDSECCLRSVDLIANYPNFADLWRIDRASTATAGGVRRRSVEQATRNDR